MFRLTAALLIVGCAPVTPYGPAGSTEESEEGEGRQEGDELGGEDPESPSPAGVRSIFKVGNFNIQWFGSPYDGPSDELLQLEHAAEVMDAAAVDIWLLSEIVDADHFEALLDRLPDHDGFVANDPVVQSGASYYGWTEQKLAVVFRRDRVVVSAPRLILTAHNYDFGSRPPLAMEVTVGAASFTLIGIHMKAYSDPDSHARRVRAAEALHDHLGQMPASQSVVVIGDWNDDIDTSIAYGSPTPFAALAADDEYRFLTREMSLANIGSRVYGHSFIDHQLVGGPLRDKYVDGSAMRVEALQIVPDYADTTSDHYPIVSTFACAGP